MFERKKKGIGILSIAVMAAALSGLVAYGSSKTVWTHYNSVGSSLEKMTARNYVLNRVEIVKASPYDKVVSGSQKLDNGFYEDLDVSEAIEDDLLVKTAKVKIYSDSSKKRLISSMIVKRTNPTAGLANDYIPKGNDGTTYNSSVVNKYFAKVDQDNNEGNIGSETHPVFVNNGNIFEIDLNNTKSSPSRTILTINNDGSLGLLGVNDFLGGTSSCFLTVGYQGLTDNIFRRLTGAQLDKEPKLGQMILALNDNIDSRRGLGLMTSHAHNTIKLVDSFGSIGDPYWVRSDFGASSYNMTVNLKVFFGWGVHAWEFPDFPRAPLFAIFGEGYDSDSYVAKDSWLLVGTLLKQKAPNLLIWRTCMPEEGKKHVKHYK